VKSTQAMDLICGTESKKDQTGSVGTGAESGESTRPLTNKQRTQLFGAAFPLWCKAPWTWPFAASNSHINSAPASRPAKPRAAATNRLSFMRDTLRQKSTDRRCRQVESHPLGSIQLQAHDAILYLFICTKLAAVLTPNRSYFITSPQGF
jgi:hypothetical protein